MFFTGDAAVGYAACLWLRTAIRVLRLVAVGDLRGPGRGGDRLYAFVRRAADWAALVPAGATLAAPPIIVQFTQPLAGAAANTAVVLTLPSAGAGNTNTAVTIHGFKGARQLA